ncbi:MAG: CsgG/HfaB family protein [Phenylobacterium sp.]
MTTAFHLSQDRADRRTGGLSRRSLFALGAAALALPAMAQAAPSAAGFGPKKRLAVAKFDAVSSFVGAYGGADAGGGLAAELATALVESGRFLVVERAEAASVLNEQELGARAATSAETAARAGQLLGAQILVIGSVTTFEQQAKGGGFSLGIGGADLGGALGRRTIRGVLGMDLRLVDTTTGQIVAARTIRTQLKQSSGSIDVVRNGANLSHEGFRNSVLGEAARDCIQRGVAFIADALRDVAWIGRVSEAMGEQVYIAAGASGGVQVGDRMQITRLAHRVTDPASGEVLGAIEEQLGTVQVAVVKDRFCVASKLSAFQPQRGDLVRYA